MEQRFNNNEIPFLTLSRFGLTRDMIEDLPEREQECMLEGRATSALPVKVTLSDGSTVSATARLSLLRTDSGEVKVMFYPRLVKEEVENYSTEDRKALQEGNTLLSGKEYHRIDPQTRQVVRVPAPVIENNIRTIAARMKLSTAEEISLKKGHLLTIAFKGRQLTLGVSFKQNTGILIVSGDQHDWQRNEKKEYLRYNFGLNGCWVAEDDGSLNYIPEESYSDDLWEEMRKQGSRHRAGLRSF